MAPSTETDGRTGRSGPNAGNRPGWCPTGAHWLRAGVVLLAWLSSSWAADPLVPTAVRPLELLWQEAKEPGLRLGMFEMHLNASAGLTYDDNLTLSSTNRQSDLIGILSAEIFAVADRRVEGQGTLLSLDYKPTFNLFVDHPSDDAVDHYAKFSALWAGPRLTLGVSQAFQQITAPVVEVGQRLRQRNYNTDVTSKYQLSEKTSIEVDPRLTISEVEGLIGSREWAVDTFLNWQALPKLVTAVGGSFGYVDIDQNPSERYERALLRAVHTATAKLDVTATVGAEWRQYNSGQASAFDPVFGLSGAYRPFDRTTLTLEAHQREQPSTILSGQDFTATGVTGEIRQRVGEPFFVSLAGGYEHRKYRATQPGVTATRQDDYALVRAGVGANFLHHWTITIFYEYQQDLSSVKYQGFRDNQVGMETTWGF